MNEWKTVRLGDVCELIMGTSPEGNTISDNPSNGIEFHQGKTFFGKVFLNESKIYTSAPSRFANAGNVIMSVRAPVGDSNITQRRIAIGRGLCTFNLKDDFEKFYLFYFLNSKIEYLQSKSTGSTFKAVNKDAISDLQIPLPPLEEQKHIAAVLDKCTALIAKHKQMLEKYDTLIKSRFIEMFGEPHDNKTFPYKLVGEFTTVTSGGTPDRKKTEYWKNGTIPWVKTTELQNNEITEIEEFITQKGLDESSAKIVPAGTLLIAMYGQGKTRGMTGYLGIEASTNQACACILPSTQINQKFLWYYFILSYDKLRDLAKGGNQPNLNGNMIKSFPVLWPPLELQNEYVRFVQQIDKSKFEMAIYENLWYNYMKMVFNHDKF